ncbi:MAG: hypothetical protein GY913_15335 [Proteobacteria bacterium]|nr:hypothetical protein [Pseudomonadota bacterium]
MPRFAHASDGEAVIPKKTGGPELVECPPTPPFHYAVNERRWGIYNGKLLPNCKAIKHLGGLNGADVGQWERALATAREQGDVVIPHDVDGEGTSYLRRHRGVGGYVYTCKWKKVFPGSDIVRSDQEGYHKWLASLIERDIIQKPRPHVLEKLRERCESKIEDYQKRDTPRARAAVERFTADLAVWDNEIALAVADNPHSEGEEVPAMVESGRPKRSRKTSTKVAGDA